MPRPRKNLQSFRERIESLCNNGISHEQILDQINAELSVQGSQSISLRTLRRCLQAWGVSFTPRSVQCLWPLYEEISELFVQDIPIETIYLTVIELLQQQGHQPVSLRTLQTQLQQWGFSRMQNRTQITDELIHRVRFYFFSYGYSDQLILRDLQAQDQLSCTLYTIRKIRYQHGMKRRFRTEEERQIALQDAIQFLEADLKQTSAIRGFGRGYLYHYVRQKGQVLVSQNRLYNFYRTVFPEEVQKRREGNFQHRTNFSVPGPNFLWCLDGYEKLKRFGIQVYACIDAYSRYIIWFYCGRSATTALSTLKQYLRTIKCLGMRPFFTRSDHGVETPLWVAAQAMLAQAGPATITYEDENQISHQFTQGNRISSCHMYGPSKRNVRIESWWYQLRGGASDRWIAFFNELAAYALFIEDNEVDQIALNAIYLPMIQDEFADFVTLWNGHKIRTQKNREHVISGIPADLYRTENARNWGVPLSTNDNAEDHTALNTMLDPLDEINIDQFLVQETEDWCTQELQSLGFYNQEIEDHTRPYISFYLALRERIRNHQESSQQPVLQLSPIPHGGIHEFVRLLQQNYELLHNQNLNGDPISQDLQEQLQQFQSEEIESI